MNRRAQKLVAGFLLVFVAISIAPRAPAIFTGVMQWSGWSTAAAYLAGVTLPPIDLAAIFDPAGEALLLIAGGLTLCLLASLTWRNLAPRRAATMSSSRRTARSTGMALARKQVRAVARPRKDDSLGALIRQAAEQGERAPALARRFGLSQDAIRAATGRSALRTVARSSPQSHRVTTAVAAPPEVNARRRLAPTHA